MVTISCGFGAVDAEHTITAALDCARYYFGVSDSYC